MRIWLIMIACCLAGGAIPALLGWMLNTHYPARIFWATFGEGCVFSFCIGFLCWSVMARLQGWLRTFRPSLLVALNGIALLVLALIGSAIAVTILWLLGLFPIEQFWPVYRHAIRIAIGITLVLGAATTIIETLHGRLEATRRELRHRELAEERARHAATEARLSSLESRIHPHFLFNTLNSISALIREDPPAAERTVERLAALLRYSLDSHTHRLVTLDREVDIVRNYLEIEHTRFGDRLRYTIDVPANLRDLEVPPLALQTLVENSIKHAVSASRSGGTIHVAASFEQGSLRIAVADDGPGFDEAALKPGHGLDSLQQRLQVLYDGAGAFSIARRDHRTVVELALPQKQVLA